MIICEEGTVLWMVRRVTRGQCFMGGEKLVVLLICKRFPLAFMLRPFSKMRCPHWRVFLCIRCRKRVWSIGVLSPLGDKTFACGLLTTLVGKKNDIRFRWSLFSLFFSLSCLYFGFSGIADWEITSSRSRPCPVMSPACLPPPAPSHDLMSAERLYAPVMTRCG